MKNNEAVQTLDIMEARKEVINFAIAMENKLRKHDDDLGNGWMTCSIKHLIECLEAEIDELKEAMDHCQPNEVSWEAVDVANFCMFIRMNLIERKQ